MIDPTILNLAVALGVGLLIGGERERRKGKGPTRSPAGIRTFAVASLAGAASSILGGNVLLAVTVAGIILLTTVAYWQRHDADPGLTTEIVLILTSLLGGLAMQKPTLAAGLAVAVTALLVARSPLHRFVRSVLTEDEMIDALLFAGATAVVLPLAPNQQLGPYGALNPHSIWILVILVMGIGAVGYVAVRILGSRLGLPVAGLTSGFVSSTATISAMGARVASTRGLLGAAVAGAALSTIATVVQLAIVLAATSTTTLRAIWLPLTCAGVAAVIYGIIFTAASLQRNSEHLAQRGRAISIVTALTFAVTLSCILLASAALREWFGEAGIVAAAALAGFADPHAAAISVASLVASGKMSSAEAVVPILAGFSTNTVSKMIVAAASGGRAFALRIVPGLILVAVAAWAAALSGAVLE